VIYLLVGHLWDLLNLNCWVEDWLLKILTLEKDYTGSCYV